MNPVDLDQSQASAVDARIELDLRSGAAFTRFLTLNLKPMIQSIQPDLKAISYGKDAQTETWLTVRLLSVSYTWICRRSILQGSEIRPRTILEYQDDAQKGRNLGQFQLGQRPLV
jgi:hypothetical protein